MRTAEKLEANALMARNLCGAMGAYSHASDRGEVVHLNSWTLVNSGINYPVFNAAILHEEALDKGDFEASLQRAGEYYRKKGVGWSCWLTEELVEGRWQREITDMMHRRRLWLVAEHEAMAADRVRPPSRALATLETRPVLDTATRADFAAICSQVFAMPSSLARDVYGRPDFWEGKFRAWVGYVKGRAVATSAADVTGGVVGIYSVATVPDCQRRGYGEAITREAIEQTSGVVGIERTMLQATEAGAPLYRKLGYRRLGRVSVYASSS